MKVRTKKLEQDNRDRTIMEGQPRPDRWVRTLRTGKQGRVSLDNWPGMSAGTCHSGQDKEDKKVRTRQQGRTAGARKPRQDKRDRTWQPF